MIASRQKLSFRAATVLLACLVLAACASPRYAVTGRMTRPVDAADRRRRPAAGSRRPCGPTR
jgi:hypothetical protein